MLNLAVRICWQKFSCLPDLSMRRCWPPFHNSAADWLGFWIIHWRFTPSPQQAEFWTTAVGDSVDGAFVYHSVVLAQNLRPISEVLVPATSSWLLVPLDFSPGQSLLLLAQKVAPTVLLKPLPVSLHGPAQALVAGWFSSWTWMTSLVLRLKPPDAKYTDTPHSWANSLFLGVVSFKFVCFPFTWFQSVSLGDPGLLQGDHSLSQQLSMWQASLKQQPRRSTNKPLRS